RYDVAATANNTQRNWIVQGRGSRLVFESLQAINGGTNYGNRLTIEAHSGGHIDLAAVTQIADGAEGNTARRGISILAQDTGSTIDLRSLTSFQDRATVADDAPSYSDLVARDGGSIRLDSLTTLDGVAIVVDALSDVPLETVSRFDHGRLQVSDRSVALPALTSASETFFTADNGFIDSDALTTLTGGGLELRSGGRINTTLLATIDGTSVRVADGITLSLPLVTSYSHASTDNDQARTLVASGLGSRLEFPNLTQIDGGTHFRSSLSVDARDGGAIDLARASQISEPDTGNTSGRGVHVTADGPGSVIDLSSLTTFTDIGESPVSHGAASGHSSLTVTRGGTIAAPALTTTTGVHIAADEGSDFSFELIVDATDSILQAAGSGTLSFASLASAAGTAIQIDGHAASLPTLTDLSAGSLFVQGGGTADAPRLVNIDSATLIASDGMTLSLPAVTSIKHETTAPNQSATLRAEGFGSRLDLSAVTSIQNGDDYNSRVFVEALSGAVVDLSSVQTIEDPDVGNASQRRIELLGEGIG
uniref:hypothetical protein n=1 Tax=Stieleria sp. TaxID=2795976 RepID=UPI003563CF86